MNYKYSALQKYSLPWKFLIFYDDSTTNVIFLCDRDINNCKVKGKYSQFSNLPSEVTYSLGRFLNLSVKLQFCKDLKGLPGNIQEKK